MTTVQVKRQNMTLQEQFDALQKRNTLLRELRAAQIANARAARSPPGNKVVKDALRKAKQRGELPTPVLQQIVELSKVGVASKGGDRPIRGPGASQAARRPLAARNGRVPPGDPRLKLKLSELSGMTELGDARSVPMLPQHPQTARTAAEDGSQSRGRSQNAAFMVTPPNTARPGGGPPPSGERYRRLLHALQLEAPPEPELLPPDEETCSGEEHVDLAETLWSPRGRSRAATAPSDLEASVTLRLAKEGGEGKRSLPGSPRWTDDMNPSHQPDGEFSREKKNDFDKALKNLCRKIRCGGTVLETRVVAKRSKQSQRLFAEARAEAQHGTGPHAGPRPAAVSVSEEVATYKASMWKTTAQGMNAQVQSMHHRRRVQQNFRV